MNNDYSIHCTIFCCLLFQEKPSLFLILHIAKKKKKQRITIKQFYNCWTLVVYLFSWKYLIITISQSEKTFINVSVNLLLSVCWISGLNTTIARVQNGFIWSDIVWQKFWHHQTSQSLDTFLNLKLLSKVYSSNFLSVVFVIKALNYEFYSYKWSNRNKHLVKLQKLPLKVIVSAGMIISYCVIIGLWCQNKLLKQCYWEMLFTQLCKH